MQDSLACANCYSSSMSTSSNKGAVAALLAGALLLAGGAAAQQGAVDILPPKEEDEDVIEIIEGRDRVVYEYRQGGLLTMIKVVPKGGGLAYYMVPADGSAHYDSLDTGKNLYPQWIVLEW